MREKYHFSIIRCSVWQQLPLRSLAAVPVLFNGLGLVCGELVRVRLHLDYGVNAPCTSTPKAFAQNGLRPLPHTFLLDAGAWAVAGMTTTTTKCLTRVLLGTQWVRYLHTPLPLSALHCSLAHDLSLSLFAVPLLVSPGAPLAILVGVVGGGLSTIYFAISFSQSQFLK